MATAGSTAAEATASHFAGPLIVRPQSCVRGTTISLLNNKKQSLDIKQASSRIPLGSVVPSFHRNCRVGQQAARGASLKADPLVLILGRRHTCGVGWLVGPTCRTCMQALALPHARARPASLVAFAPLRMARTMTVGPSLLFTSTEGRFQTSDDTARQLQHSTTLRRASYSCGLHDSLPADWHSHTSIRSHRQRLSISWYWRGNHTWLSSYGPRIRIACCSQRRIWAHHSTPGASLAYHRLVSHAVPHFNQPTVVV